MATGSHSEPQRRSDSTPDPDVLVCETCPGRSVFVESGNVHGWIATDVTVDLDR